MSKAKSKDEYVTITMTLHGAKGELQAQQQISECLFDLYYDEGEARRCGRALFEDIMSFMVRKYRAGKRKKV